MSEATFGSLLDLIRSNRNARDETAGALDASPHAERAGWRLEIAAFDQDYRQRLAAIDELPALLPFAVEIQEGWPYPSDEALERFRAQVARLGHRTMTEVDALPLHDVLRIVGEGSAPSPPPTSGTIREREGIEEVDVSRLPRWARVAYVARCARRAYRLLLAEAPDPEADGLRWFDGAIAAAERSAANGRPDRDIREAAEEAQRRARGGMGQAAAQGSRPRAVPIYDQLLLAVGNAAAQAAKAVLEHEPTPASESFEQARNAAYTVGSRSTLESMARDWNFLRTLSSKEHWDDQTPVAPTRVPSPSLEVTGLYIKGLRAIQKFELPRDGLGWGDRIPGLVLLGGVNGSGKTTLLQFITEALQLITKPLAENFVPVIPKAVDAREAWLDFEIEAFEIPRTRMRFIVGDEEFFRNNRGDSAWGFRRTPGGGGYFEVHGNGTRRARQTILDWFAGSTIPSVLSFSSEERTLVVPYEVFKAAGKLTTPGEFVHRWQRPTHWKESLEAILYSLRWEDLNARAERRYTSMGGFEAYAEAFRRFTGATKSLSWEQAALVVRLAHSAVRHDLTELSSGEKQVLLLTGELLRHWKPGSLVLIDEPELHLHSIWQTKLCEALRFWQLERGGQVIMTTQSSHLFRTVEPGTAALLGADSL